MDGKSAQTLLMLELVSPVTDTGFVLNKAERKEIYRKYKEKLPWKDVFSHIKSGQDREKLIELFEKLEGIKDSDK